MLTRINHSQQPTNDHYKEIVQLFLLASVNPIRLNKLLGNKYNNKPFFIRLLHLDFFFFLVCFCIISLTPITELGGGPTQIK